METVVKRAAARNRRGRAVATVMLAMAPVLVDVVTRVVSQVEQRAEPRINVVVTLSGRCDAVVGLR